MGRLNETRPTGAQVFVIQFEPVNAYVGLTCKVLRKTSEDHQTLYWLPIFFKVVPSSVVLVSDLALGPPSQKNVPRPLYGSYS